MRELAIGLLVYVAVYPVATASLWIAGGLLFRLLDEHSELAEPPGGWPGVTVLIPAYNEEAVIATSVQAALEVDYPALEVLVLDDGSTDATSARAAEAAGGDARCEVVTDPVNRGKADRLNLGFERARHELVVVTDADTHVHPLALQLLVTRLLRSPLTVAVAGAPHVTNRTGVLPVMQTLEGASIIGLIRRTQSLTGRVGTVAGVLGIFRRQAVLDVGGYDGQMATEDIDLSWRLLLAGWHTAYEPDALVGMQVPAKVNALWAQRRRWARGQGEVLHKHFTTVARWRNRRTWYLLVESVASLTWVVGLAVGVTLAVLNVIFGHALGLFGFGLAWGIAIAVVATLQLAFALRLDISYDRHAVFAFLAAPLYPIAFWLVSGLAALREEAPAAFRGPREKRVVWDVPREEAQRTGT